MTTTASVHPADNLPARVRRFFEPAGRRYLIYAVAALVFAVLSVFPRYYLSRVKLVNQDSQANGLNSALSMLGGIQNFASLLGSHQNAEVYLMVGRSNEVVTSVIKQLKLVETHHYPSVGAAMIGLDRKVDIHTLNGGVMEITVKDRDPDYALKLVQAYRTAIELRVKSLSRDQATHKKELVTERFTDATQRLAEAQTKLESFRRANNLAEPGIQFGSALSMRTAMEGELRAKQIQLQTARQFNTDQSIEVKTILADIGAIQGQLASMDASAGQAAGLQSLASKSVDYLNLYRDEQFAEALLAIYTRSLEQVTVSELLADSNQDLSTLEEPFVEPRRPFNIFGLAPLGIVLLLAFYIEYYVPLTRLGYRRGQRA